MGARLHPSLGSPALGEPSSSAHRGTWWFNAPCEGLGNACGSGDEQRCSAPARQGVRTGQGDTTWEQRQAHGQERCHQRPCHVKFMLAHFFPCCQFSKVSPKPALSLHKFGAVLEAGSNTAGARWLTWTWRGEAPETRHVPALPGHPGSPVLPDFHMATKALPHQAPGHGTDAWATSQPPKTWPRSQAPCTPAA